MTKGKSSKDDERRRYKREDEEIDVSYSLPGKEKEIKAKACNISQKGMMLETENNIAELEKLKVALKLSLDEEKEFDRLFSADSKVVWSKKSDDSGEDKYQCGVEFTDMTPEDVKKLYLYLRKLRQFKKDS